MDLFLQRIKNLMEKHGIGSAAAFDRASGLTNKAARWFNENYRPDSVDTDTLISIATRFNVSYDWLLREDKPSSALEETPASYDSRPPTPLDESLMADVLDVIGQAIKKYKIKLNKEQNGVLVKKVYDECAENKFKPDEDLVKHYLLLKGS